MKDCLFIVTFQFPTLLAPQQTWIRIIEICGGALLILALLHLIVGWVWHLSWRVRLLALVPLIAGIGAGVAAYTLQNTYMYWINFLCNLPMFFPQWFQAHYQQEIADANHTAAVLGWVVVAVMGFMLVLSFWVVSRVVVSRRKGPQSSISLAIEP